MTPDELAPYIDLTGAKPATTAMGMAVAMGVTAEEFTEEIRKQSGAVKFEVPAAWLQRGHQRASEYAAITGRTDDVGLIEYWLEREGEGR